MIAGEQYHHDHTLFARERNDTRVLLWRLKRLAITESNRKHRFLQRKLAALEQVTPSMDAIYRLPLLTPAQCARVVAAADAWAANVGWSRERHANFPTNDLQATAIPGLMDWLGPRLADVLLPFVEARFGLDIGGLYLVDLFVVSYEVGGQRGLEAHEDSSLLTFSCLLNAASEFRGGGLYLSAIDQRIALPPGEAVVHAGKWLHQGLPIESGRRVILVGFLGHRSVDHEAFADVD
ncbi:MAG: hypothetical protein H6983_11755 [Ectothiorhodospiraceae bacterium]|nr:hypothetical protein [Chromatiales bacterium]MCP5154835.1 hypothetical protein [Ectothiorhodospiraceae bacterium]